MLFNSILVPENLESEPLCFTVAGALNLGEKPSMLIRSFLEVMGITPPYEKFYLL